MIGYVAKDKDGEIYLHTEKPTYNNELEGWYSAPDMINITNQFPKFNDMSYTDKPIKVEIKLEKV
jgi:hypothetical protein